MSKWKFLALAGVIAASAAITACGDDSEVSCTVDDDCASDEICASDDICRLACSDAEPCPEGSTCAEEGACFPDDIGGEACEGDEDCDVGQICDLSTFTCVDDETPLECDDATCAEETGFCTLDNECQSVACDVDFNDCGVCGMVTRSANGPLIYDLRADCVANSTTCPDAGQVECTWTFLFFDPDGLGSIGNDQAFRKISSGSSGTGFSTRVNGDEISFKTCEQSGAPGSMNSAIHIEDADGNSSNALCFEYATANQ